MTTWSKDELRKIAEADDLHISPFREDGVTYGTPTWIWSIAVGDALYVRAYNGQNSRWYQAAVRQKAGRITAAGMTKEVTFEPVDGPINDLVDDAYRAKYHGSPYLSSMIGARARLRDSQGHAARDQRLIVSSTPREYAGESQRGARADAALLRPEKFADLPVDFANYSDRTIPRDEKNSVLGFRIGDDPQSRRLRRRRQ